MAQHDYVIANGTGAAVRSDLNNGLSAIVTQNSGATEPATTYAFMRWADTTAGVMKMRNSANNAWITLYQLDGEWTNIAFENGTAAAPSIYFKDSGTDTGFYSPGANQVGISTGGTARLTIDSNGNVDIDSNTLYVDATNNRVGLGTSSPGAILDVAPDANRNLQVQGKSATTYGLEIKNGTANSSGEFHVTAASSGAVVINRGSTEIARFNSTGLGIGSTAAPGKLTVATTSADPVASLSAWTDGYSLVSPGGTSTSGGIGFSFNTTTNIGHISCATPGTAWRDLIYQAITHRFMNGGSELVRIDSSGRLLVGTSSSRGNFFNTTGVDPRVQIEGTDGLGCIYSAIGNFNGAGGEAQLFLSKSRGTTVGSNTIVQNGDGIGAIQFQGSDGSEFVQAAEIKAFVDGTPGANDMPGRLVFSTTADGASSPTERMRITSDPLSSVLIGQTTNPATSSVVIKVQTGAANGINAQITSNTGTSFPWGNYNASGTYVGGMSCTSTATSFPTSSDYRLKTNVQPLADAIGLVAQLKPSTFEFNENLGETVQGFIAHELQEVVPLAVIGEKDAEDANGNPVYQGVDAAKLVPLLTAALQEAIAKIETLEAKVAALEAS
jgi:hypothetical protein